jgi:3-keto-5-aminohexanoate cleavage enzyme
MKPMAWKGNNISNYLGMIARQEMPPVIISVALTGGIQGKETNPNLPETPEEQAQQASEAFDAGASVVHVHARDPTKGYASASVDPEQYREINKQIRKQCPRIIINNTTGGGLGNLTTEERMRSLEANPELASINMGPLAWKAKLKKREPPLSGRPSDVFLDSIWPPTFSWGETELFAKRMLEKGIKPEMEVYHQGQFQLVYNLIEKKLVNEPYLIQFVMGAPSGVLPTPGNLMSMLENSPPNAVISVIGTGPHQLPLTTFAIAMGLHVRVGLEDNVYYKKGILCEDNAQLVARAARIAEELNRDIASPEQTREILGLKKEPTQYL